MSEPTKPTKMHQDPSGKTSHTRALSTGQIIISCCALVCLTIAGFLQNQPAIDALKWAIAFFVSGGTLTSVGGQIGGALLALAKAWNEKKPAPPKQPQENTPA